MRAPYITTVLSGLEAGDHVADRGDFTGGFGTDHQRQLALRKRHAAIAPDVDVIERDGLDADLHFAGARWRRRRNIGDHELTIGNESERAHDAVSPAEMRFPIACVSPVDDDDVNRAASEIWSRLDRFARQDQRRRSDRRSRTNSTSRR